MRRREFITLLCGTAAAARPIATRAQQSSKIARVGFLGATTAANIASRLEAFRSGLRRLGYVEGKNMLIDFRWAEGKYDQLPVLAAELVGLNVDVLVTYGTPGTLAAKQVTVTVPIVMAGCGDAVAGGIVASLARPGGNITGSTFSSPELNAKQIELLKEAFPSTRRVAFLFNPNNPNDLICIRVMELGAKSLGVEVQQIETRGPNEFDLNVSAAVERGADAVAVSGDAMFLANSDIARIARSNRLVLVGAAEVARAGGLIGYGPRLLELYRRAGYFVDKILKGTKPADLPVEQPTKFELVINLKTAKTLGLEVSPLLLARADEVIE
jgi:putative ABC transport system substrate-binding protein